MSPQSLRERFIATVGQDWFRDAVNSLSSENRVRLMKWDEEPRFIFPFEDANGVKIGEIRIGPDGISWKPDYAQLWNRVPLAALAIFIAHAGERTE